MYQGTWQPNKKPVITSAPDCLVFLNGELSLPSGSNPYRRIDIQPLVNSVSVNLGVNNSPGSASVNLHIPRHYRDDFFRGGHLSLTTMMEIQIYFKGHFSVGGAPRFYPAFWGVVTSVNESFSGGEHTVSMSCTDILYWWKVQQINLNPSIMSMRHGKTKRLNLEGNHFTDMDPFNVLYSLSRYAYGDSVNAQTYGLPNREMRSETDRAGVEHKQLMTYWTQKWGRISNSLKMYGPRGQVLQGATLARVLRGDNRRQFLKGKDAIAERYQAQQYEPITFDGINLQDITPFSRVVSKMGAPEIWASEFQPKINIAQQTKESIGYEFYMDVTGEMIFKPPFYNLDVRPNFPVSWVRDRDVVDWNFAENPPEATYIEATGFIFDNLEAGIGDLAQNRANYVDYRLVQKYGWRPGSFSSEFIGSDTFGGPKALFYHLVDILDRENARVNSGTATIPIRPELRLGYPVYVEGKDAYYYVEGISHTFSYGGRCTTQLTLMAKRGKFYADFPNWDKNHEEPKAGDVARPGIIPTNLYKRPIDTVSGTPVGDRNVILSYFPGEALSDTDVETFSDDVDDSEVLLRNLVSLRSQFSAGGRADKYAYMIDPSRGEKHELDNNGNRIKGPLTHIEANPQDDTDEQDRKLKVNAVTFPVSDERGYEVLGAYEYGRRVTINPKGFVFDKSEADVVVEGLLYIRPDDGTTPTVDEGRQETPANVYEVDVNKDQNFMVDPNNYGQLLSQVEPPSIPTVDLAGAAKIAAQKIKDHQSASRPAAATVDPSQQYIRRTDVSAQSKDNRTFRYNSNVARWRSTIRQVREEEGLSEEQYPDEVILSFIHVESDGDPTAHRRGSQYYGPLQIGESNAKDVKDDNGNVINTHTDFANNSDDPRDHKESIRHFLRYQETYSDRHNGDPVKMAMIWKGGPGFTRQYNRMEARGATPQELDHFAATYPPPPRGKDKDGNPKGPWGIDRYISRHKAAETVWHSATQPFGSSPVAEEDDDRVLDEADYINFETINDSGLPDEEQETQVHVKAFASALEANKKSGQLPSNIQPPRDPSVMGVINDFLSGLYESAFVEGRQREKELRGETKGVARSPDAASVPTEGRQDRRAVDSPFTRKEISDALDEGRTLNDILGPEGPIEKIKQSLDED